MMGISNSFYGRVFQSLIFYLLFTLFYIFFGFYKSIIIIFGISAFSFFQIIILDKSILVSRRSLLLVISVVIYFIFMTFLLLPRGPLRAESVVKVVFEEMLFRFSMLGIVKKYLNYKKNYRKVFTLILNGILFSFLHFQYNTIWDYSTIFIQGLNFALTYLSLGIFPSIITHLLWNYYFPNIVPQLPILILTIGLPLYDNYQSNRKDRMERIMHVK